MQASVYIHFNT